MLAILNERGEIIAVKPGSRDPVPTSPFLHKDAPHGSNYLELCERMNSSPVSAQIASGIRDVLDGLRERFCLEYEDKTADAERWCRITVMRFDDSGKIRALVLHETLDEVINASAGLEFEDLFADFTATLMRTNAHEIDDEIERWLGRIGLALELDRTTIAQLNRDGQNPVVTHAWAREGVQPIPVGLEVATVMPWLTRKAMRGESVVFSDEQELPLEARPDLEWVVRLGGISSHVMVPLTVAGVVHGAVGFGSIYRRRPWSPRSIRRLQMVSEVFGSALLRKRIAVENIRLANEIHQVSRAATMGEMTAALAHELNQPLAAILNNSRVVQRLLAAKSPDLNEIRAALDDIVRDNARAVEIVRDVRSVFQPGEAKMSPVDMKQVLQDIKRMVSADAKTRNIALSINSSDRLAPVIGDRPHLIEVLLNLILNAFDAVCESDNGPREVTVVAEERSPGELRVSIRDSGRGIDSEALAHLFEPFFTTKSSGMGMGLTIARSIVHNHGGRLWAVQNPDRGATFEFTLPAQPAARIRA